MELLRELAPVGQDSDKFVKRYFQSDAMKLFLWENQFGEPVSFQLAYGPETAPRVLEFRNLVLSHFEVDRGESLHTSVTLAGLLKPARMPADRLRLAREFDASAHNLPETIRRFVVKGLNVEDKPESM